MKKTIITISRQHGSGGREIGRKLAQTLDIPFYDKEVITLPAKKSGYAPELFEKADQKATSSLLYALSMFGTTATSYNPTGYDGLPLADKLFIVQSDTIRSIAAEGSCVIVGRCADYVLQDDPSCINIFLTSSWQNRLRRATREYELVPAQAEDILRKTDKKRAAYYNFYTGLKWGDVNNYHLCLNTDDIGIENAVKYIAEYVKIRNGE